MVWIPEGARFFFCNLNIQSGCGPPILLFTEYLGSFSRVKRLVCEVVMDFNLLQWFRMGDAVPLLPLYVLMVWVETALSLPLSEVGKCFKWVIVRGFITFYCLRCSVSTVGYAFLFRFLCSFSHSALLSYDRPVASFKTSCPQSVI